MQLSALICGYLRLTGKKPQSGGQLEMQAGRVRYRGELNFKSFDDFCQVKKSSNKFK